MHRGLGPGANLRPRVSSAPVQVPFLQNPSTSLVGTLHKSTYYTITWTLTKQQGQCGPLNVSLTRNSPRHLAALKATKHQCPEPETRNLNARSSKR